MAKKIPGSATPKRALCVGINDYPFDGHDLNGCVNDAHAWVEVLTSQFGFPTSSVRVMTDAQATRKNILTAFKDLLAGAKPGDIVVFTNSSHGSYVVDVDGDEEDGYDEVLCPYDIKDNHIADDDLRMIIENVNEKVRLTVVLDNCFSGTATRAAIDEIVPGTANPDHRRVRFLSPALRGMRVLENPWRAKPKGEAKYPESKMKDVLLSGCTDREYSFDALIDSTYHGAMTYFATSLIKQTNGKLSYDQWHRRLQQALTDHNFNQHPQLEGKSVNKKRPIFA